MLHQICRKNSNTINTYISKGGGYFQHNHDYNFLIQIKPSALGCIHFFILSITLHVVKGFIIVVGIFYASTY